MEYQMKEIKSDAQRDATFLVKKSIGPFTLLVFTILSEGVILKIMRSKIPNFADQGTLKISSS